MRNRAKRSLSATTTSLNKANETLRRFSSKIAFADLAGVSRATVQKFFAGKAVGFDSFKAICKNLELDWEEVAGLMQSATIQMIKDEESDNGIINIVQMVRDKLRPLIHEQCGTMKVLDMSQPIKLEDIYTNVNILEKVSHQRWIELSQIIQNFDPSLENFDRLGLSKITGQRVPGLKAVSEYPRLMIWGKPGSGKTTFLKNLSIQCIFGEFNIGRVPIYISMKEFSEIKYEPNLKSYIISYIKSSGVELQDEQILDLFYKGRLFIMLDGLDEVREKNINRVIQEVQSLADKFFYSDDFKIDSQNYLKDNFQKIRKVFPDRFYNNQFIITCRIAAQEYRFSNFIDVEIADFDELQIKNFVNKWFAFKDKTKIDTFVKKLNQNQPVRELGTNPLLLTLLCLVFEEIADFPSSRSELYKEGLDILLKKWDAKRNIERDQYQLYKKLSVQRKEDLLSSIAAITFERGDYFFKKKQVEECIADYIQNLPDSKTDPKALQLDSEGVLMSIESQHGILVERAHNIYSFSHLTFQEYFTARKIITTPVPQKLEIALQSLANHIFETRWREVIILTVEMLQNADILLELVKQKIDKITNNIILKTVLDWVNQKANSVVIGYKKSAIRFFYLSLIISPINTPNLLSKLDQSLKIEGELDIDRRFFVIFDNIYNAYNDLISYLKAYKANQKAQDTLNEVFVEEAMNKALYCHLLIVKELLVTLRISVSFGFDKELKKLEKLLPIISNDDSSKMLIKTQEKFEQWWNIEGKSSGQTHLNIDKPESG
ncbi:NACHT domain-containing NTPase [Nostoc sp. LEGE 12447]|uniref:NACHT domain-containing protein n=1 Tax=Nostoc sp. LEGE 12447 TaxID=1828640 RepID=UPI0018836680|nr:NACHT domain-containing protein [Nostoc sp. LEGE 12447]MBE9003362.1 NACHT domain-containing NTPase [Nostoc sp. LEGE 12447]